MDVNQAVVRILESTGITHMFGGSGQVNASMLLALNQSKRIKTVIVRNEQAASFMACGYAMFSDKPGVCFATGGPGAFNLFSGMAVALSDSLPVLAITGYVSAGMKGKGALNESSGLHRTPNSHEMFKATTKKSYLVERPDQICETLEDALNVAVEGRPGPVHVHIPKDVTGATVNNYRDIRIETKPVLPDEAVATAIAQRLVQAGSDGEAVVLLIGYGAIRSHAEEPLLDLIERIQLPFMTTMDAKGILPEDHPLALGVYGTSGDPGANAYFERAKVVLALGNSFAQNATFAYKEDLYANKILIHVNIDPAEIDKVYRAQLALVSDVRPALEQILRALKDKVAPVPRRPVLKDLWHSRPLTYDGPCVHPGELARHLSQLLPANGIVLGDAGSHMLWLNCYLHLTANQRYQNPGSFGPMASHTNGALGVKCANPDKCVVAGVGDGGYLMGGFELLTAVEYDIPVVWVIFNNGEFNIIKKFLVDTYGEHAFMRFRNPDFVKYAESCGAQGYRVNRIHDFDEVFLRAVESKRPALIDVSVDPDVYPPFALGRV